MVSENTHLKSNFSNSSQQYHESDEGPLQLLQTRDSHCGHCGWVCTDITVVSFALP